MKNYQKQIILTLDFIDSYMQFPHGRVDYAGIDMSDFGLGQ